MSFFCLSIKCMQAVSMEKNIKNANSVYIMLMFKASLASDEVVCIQKRCNWRRQVSF